MVKGASRASRGTARRRAPRRRARTPHRPKVVRKASAKRSASHVIAPACPAAAPPPRRRRSLPVAQVEIQEHRRHHDDGRRGGCTRGHRSGIRGRSSDAETIGDSAMDCLDVCWEADRDESDLAGGHDAGAVRPPHPRNGRHRGHRPRARRTVATAGNRVVIANRNAELGEKVVAELKGKLKLGDGAVTFTKMDLCDLKSVNGALSTALERLGGVDTVFANSGFPSEAGYLEDVLAGRNDAWITGITGNLVGTMALGSAAAKHWLENDLEGTLSSRDRSTRCTSPRKAQTTRACPTSSPRPGSGSTCSTCSSSSTSARRRPRRPRSSTTPRSSRGSSTPRSGTDSSGGNAPSRNSTAISGHGPRSTAAGPRWTSSSTRSWPCSGSPRSTRESASSCAARPGR
ncbi:hypothetical protein DFJ74DRAFT_344181 [Hyaloraphidium curvatum]|nr:hypothetical protein DFJ74DRAFT_344181 [Hyaloraphidium curvatum]